MKIVDCHTHIYPGEEDSVREYYKNLRLWGEDAYAILLPVHLKQEFREYCSTNDDIENFVESLDYSINVITAMTYDISKLNEKTLINMIEKKQEQFPKFKPIFKIVPNASDYTLKDLLNYEFFLDIIEKTGTVLFTHLDYTNGIKAQGKNEEKYNSPREIEKILDKYPDISMHLAHFGGEQFRFVANCLSEDYEKNFDINQDNVKYVIDMINSNPNEKQRLISYFKEQGYNIREITNLGNREKIIFNEPIIWTDNINKLINYSGNISTGTEGLVYPAENNINYEEFFNYSRNQGYFNNLKQKGQLLLGSDYPTNGVDGIIDMNIQSKDKTSYNKLIGNNTNRFLK